VYKDPQRQRESQKLRVRKIRAEFFRDKECKCGSIERLELHHLDPITKVSHRVWYWSKEHRDEELLKCIVLCYKCHKIETAKQRMPKHGTASMYVHGCRCSKCRYANTQKAQRYRALKKVAREALASSSASL
jgi:hypothetical protein